MKAINTKTWILALIAIGTLALADNPPAKPVTDMVRLDDILEERANNMGMVPAAAANDPDFISFMTAIRSRDRITGKPRPVARSFEEESQTSGLNFYELYQKMKIQLEALKATSQQLYGIVFLTSQGLGQNSFQIATSAQVSIEWGVRVGFGIGWERRGRWFVPIMTVRVGYINAPSSGWTTIGVLADAGVETRTSPEAPAMISSTEADMGGFAVGVGFSKLSCSTNSEKMRFNGVMVGAGSNCYTEYKGATVKIPFFLPIPGVSPMQKAIHLEAKIIQALQRFNMTKAAALMTQYKVAVAKAMAQAGKLGLSPQAYNLEHGHPLLSPGNLFSGSALVAYSPSLAPDLVALYKDEASGKRGRIKGCEGAVIDIGPANPAKTTKQLPE